MAVAKLAMAAPEISQPRLQRLNQRDQRKGNYVLYWMQQAQRADYNDALEYAIQSANSLNQPLLAVFGLMHDYPEANQRHYAFMLEGLRETQSMLRERGIQLIVKLGAPPQVALAVGEQASIIICDRGYLRHQQQWRDALATRATCTVIQVETDAIVPVETTSDKQEIAARTIRPKIQKRIESYLQRPVTQQVKKDSLGLRFDNSAGFSNQDRELDLDNALAQLNIDRSVARSHYFKGGASPARALLHAFLSKNFDRYADKRSDPGADAGSHMSPYLHFGQIAALEIALAVRQQQGADAARAAFLEEMIVRRELSVNFVHFQPDYDKFTCLPAWAKSTLHKHRRDRREHAYDLTQLKDANTHDRYWNAAMREMKITGYMHNTMRMYWGKKILEWSATPEQAFGNALTLNNKYFLDGRDANSYANVAWLFGLHDRPFPERLIYGTVRCMTAGGLERKYDIEAYVQRIAALD
ncbi:MAG: deoxyribodipyrimidine photo-lyase [Pseudomonadota bacterium]|nr:deoxyribodipyrimidine photo-lyase [Pseudomonadota bacterium]